MRARTLARITVGMTGLTSMSGLGWTALRIASGSNGLIAACMVITVSFAMTSLVALVGLILDYQLRKLAVQAQAASAERDNDLRRIRLELQRSILDKICEGEQGAQAYQTMATADALLILSSSSGTQVSPVPRNLTHDSKSTLPHICQHPGEARPA